MPLLLDTGFLYALADESDDWHRRSRDYLAQNREVLLVPVTVVPEVCYLLRFRLGAIAERKFVQSVGDEELSIEPVTPRDFKRSTELLGKYPDIGFVDASVVAVAERLKLRTIATTDHRHFGPLRPAHVDSFDLVP